jgi:aspartate ammonia-lyase
MLTLNCVAGIVANEEVCKNNVDNSTATVTALISKIGYENAAKIAAVTKKENLSVREAAIKLNLLSNIQFEDLINPEAVTRWAFNLTVSV